MTWIKAPENWRSVSAVKDNAPNEFDEPVSFNESGTANVKEPIAEYLVNEYDQIEYTNNDA